jgi:hypothetical protein
MLVRSSALTAAGGLGRIRGARIDDVALGRLLKGPSVRCWLGLSAGIRGRRPCPRLADLWDMIARSAYTQLRYSPAALAGTIAGLLWIYVLPPAAAAGGLLWTAAGGGAWAGWIALAGLASWTLHDDHVRAGAAAVRTLAAAGRLLAADSPRLRGDDQRLGSQAPGRPWRRVEGPHDRRLRDRPSMPESRLGRAIAPRPDL